MAPQPDPVGRAAGGQRLFPPVPSPPAPGRPVLLSTRGLLGFREKRGTQFLQMFPLLCPGNMLSHRPSHPHTASRPTPPRGMDHLLASGRGAQFRAWGALAKNWGEQGAEVPSTTDPAGATAISRRGRASVQQRPLQFQALGQAGALRNLPPGCVCLDGQQGPENAAQVLL